MPSLVIAIAPLKVPLVFGANVTVTTRLLFRASVNLPPPDALNGLPKLLVSTLPCNTPSPLFSIVNFSRLVSCTLMAGKLSAMDDTLNVPATPVPATPTCTAGLVGSLLLIVMLPDDSTAEVGANSIVSTLV